MRNIIKIATLLVFAIAILTSSDALAQKVNQAENRLNNVKRTKLVEMLNLSDSEKEKFNETFNSWQDKLQAQRKINQQANTALRELLDKNPNSAELTKKTDEVIKAQEQMHNLMQQRNNDLRKKLSPAQFAIFLLYDKRFMHDVQNSMMKFYEKRGKGNNNFNKKNYKSGKFQGKYLKSGDCDGTGNSSGTCKDPNCPNHKK